jgi:SynChlorMet cassette radical SAM/SPASM protein ScmE
MHVTLQGGEPLLRADFLDLVDGIIANRMRFSVLTNGTLLTPQIADRLQQTGRCDMVQVSLDGSTAEVHESLRGGGTYHPALSAIRLLQRYTLPVTVRVTIHPGNIADLPQIARLLLRDLQLPSFSTNAASSLGISTKYGSGVLLNTAQRYKAIKTMASLDKQYPGRIQANAGPLADWRMFSAMEKARRTGLPVAGRGRLVGCGCIFESFAVRSDGAYIPCVMLPHMVLGRIGETPLTEVWQTAEALCRLRERRGIALEEFDECRLCEWQSSCTGNCPGTAFTATGKVDRPCPSTCLKRFHQELAAEGLSLWT